MRRGQDDSASNGSRGDRNSGRPRPHRCSAGRASAVGRPVSVLVWPRPTPHLTSVTSLSARLRSSSCREFFSGTARQRSRRVTKAPLRAVQVAALRHPNPSTRKECLFFLDHYANDGSIDVFSVALADPVDSVRNLAMHSLACTSCKVEALSPAEVVPGLVKVISTDPRPDLRVRAISMLLHLASDDEAARDALEPRRRAIRIR